MAVTPLPFSLKLAHSYLLSSHNEALVKADREKARDTLKPWIIANAEPDENGCFTYEFPDPLIIGGVSYAGLMAQRRVTEWTNDEKATKLAEKYGLQDRCIKKTVTYEVDLDELYACNQEGLIPDEDIDSVIETEVSYSLVKVRR